MTPRNVIPTLLLIFCFILWIRMSPEWRQGIIWGIKFLCGIFTIAFALMYVVFAIALNRWAPWIYMFVR